MFITGSVLLRVGGVLRMNECKGCPIFEDGYRSYEMCYMCDYWNNNFKGGVK